MKLRDFLNEDTDIIEEMKEYFEIRTDTHIERVQKYADRVSKHFNEFKELSDIVDNHDDSKWKEPEYTPYLYITWSYKCKREGVEFDVPESIKDKMHRATTHHVLNNKHHPEYWCGLDDVISKTDRDSTHKQIDGTQMPDIYIAEMVCDWSAMAEEYGEKSGPYKWADDNINKRWIFNDRQVSLIYDIMDFLWK